MSVFSRNVPRAEAIASYAALRHTAAVIANLKLQGLCLHNAIVDKAFVLDKYTPGATQQVPDASLFVACATEAECIVRVNALRPYIVAHFDDGTYAHSTPDATSKADQAGVPAATDSASLTTLLVAIRTAVNRHYATDAGHNRILIAQTITTVPVDAATNLAVTNTLLKTLQSHLFSGGETLVLDGI